MKVSLYLDHAKYGAINIDNEIASNDGTVYHVGDRINSGGNAVVHRCENAVDGTEYAIKFNLNSKGNRLERFMQEIDILKKISHDQIIQYVGDGFVDGVSARPRGGTMRIPFLIMPLAESNLNDFVNTNRGRIPHSLYIGQFRGLCDAMVRLHSHALHRDLKPENILLIGDTWMISDLGLCSVVTGEGGGLTMPGEPIGPRYWMSPEALNSALGNSDCISIKSDVYQLASIFWYVVTGRYPQGIVTESDWTGPQALFEPLYKSLHHNPAFRLNTAQELLNAIA